MFQAKEDQACQEGGGGGQQQQQSGQEIQVEQQHQPEKASDIKRAKTKIPAGAKRRRRLKKLFSQQLEGALSETATNTPLKSDILPVRNVHDNNIHSVVEGNNDDDQRRRDHEQQQQQQQEVPLPRKRSKTKLVMDGRSGQLVAKKEVKEFKVPAAAAEKKKKKKKNRPTRTKDKKPDSSSSSSSSNISSSSSILHSVASDLGRRRRHHGIIPARRSSLEFVKMTMKEKRIKPMVPVISEIVCTSCSVQDVKLVQQLLKKFPSRRLVLGKSVGAKTTHVICGETDKRTLNVLRGMLRGCWILTSDWIRACHEAGAWEDEEDYEMITFSSAVKACRCERQAFGAERLRRELFADCGAIYVSRRCRAPAKELGDLVRLAGGRVVNVARVASVVVGTDDVETADACVGEKWILDSIQAMRVLDLEKYAL